jgi:tetratricopeptide (TPR) repeat protein
MTLNYAITAACEAGRLDRAATLLAEAQQVLKADPSSTAYSRGLIDGAAARVALVRGDVSDAVELAERAVATLRTATPNQASLPSTQVLLARALNAAGRHRAALEPAGLAEAATRRRLGGIEHSFLVGHALIEIAAARAALGEHDAARSALASGLEHLNATVTPKSRVIQRAHALEKDLH